MYTIDVVFSHESCRTQGVRGRACEKEGESARTHAREGARGGGRERERGRKGKPGRERERYYSEMCNLPTTEHPQPNKLQDETRAVRRFEAPLGASQAGQKIGHHACRLVERKHDGDLHRGEALVVGSKQHNHAHGAVRKRVDHVAQRDDDERQERFPLARLLAEDICLGRGLIVRNHRVPRRVPRKGKQVADRRNVIARSPGGAHTRHPLTRRAEVQWRLYRMEG